MVGGGSLNGHMGYFRIKFPTHTHRVPHVICVAFVSSIQERCCEPKSQRLDRLLFSRVRSASLNHSTNEPTGCWRAIKRRKDLFWILFSTLKLCGMCSYVIVVAPHTAELSDWNFSFPHSFHFEGVAEFMRTCSCHHLTSKALESSPPSIPERRCLA